MGLIFKLGELDTMKERGLKLSPSEICEKFAHIFKTNTLAESLFYKGISDVLCGNSKFCYDLRLTDFFIKNKDIVVKEMLDMFYITEYKKAVEVDQFIFNLGNKGEMDFTLLFKKDEDVDFELLYLLSHYVYACYNIAHQTDIRKILKPIKMHEPLFGDIKSDKYECFIDTLITQKYSYMSDITDSIILDLNKMEFGTIQKHRILELLLNKNVQEDLQRLLWSIHRKNNFESSECDKSLSFLRTLYSNNIFTHKNRSFLDAANTLKEIDNPHLILEEIIIKLYDFVDKIIQRVDIHDEYNLVLKEYFMLVILRQNKIENTVDLEW